MTDDPTPAVPERTQPNILTGCTAARCHRTFAHLHEATNGSEGVVRRCEHGKVWLWHHRAPGYVIDCWERVSPFWEPLLYRRALKQLRTQEVPRG